MTMNCEQHELKPAIELQHGIAAITALTQTGRSWYYSLNELHPAPSPTEWRWVKVVADLGNLEGKHFMAKNLPIQKHFSPSVLLFAIKPIIQKLMFIQIMK